MGLSLTASSPLWLRLTLTFSTLLDRPSTCFFFVWFPLEFNFAHRDTRAIVGDEMEHHLQLGSAATTGNNGFELSFTIVGSELLLAEAATKTMATSKCV